MARARQPVTFTDLLEVASRLPWKVSLGVAGISLLALHLLAAAFAPASTVTTVADMGGVVIYQAIHVGAFLLQFVVPPAFLIGRGGVVFQKIAVDPPTRQHPGRQRPGRGIAHVAAIREPGGQRDFGKAGSK